MTHHTSGGASARPRAFGRSAARIFHAAFLGRSNSARLDRICYSDVRRRGSAKKASVRRTPGVPSIVLMLSVLATSLVAAASVVVVSHDGQHQWQSRITDGNGNPDPSYGSVTFVTGPGAPPRGIGSLRLQTNLLKGDGSAQMRTTRYGQVRLANLNELTYWAYSAMNNGQQFPFLALNVSNTGGSTTDDILFFEPPYQSPGNGGPT